MCRRLVLVRHGPPAEQHRGRFLGSTDVALAEPRSGELASLTRAVRALEPDRFFSSPLRRARETAEAIMEPARAPLVIEPGLREIDFGRWEGETFGEVAAADPAAVARWASGDQGFAFPGGESIRGFLARVRRVAARLASSEAATVVAFTHAGVIRHLLCHFLGLPEARHPLLFDVQYSALTVVRLFDGNGVLAGLNLRSTSDGGL